MKKIKFRSALSYEVTESSFEKGGGDSLAVPNEAYTARELYEKYVKGVPIPALDRDWETESRSKFYLLHV